MLLAADCCIVLDSCSQEVEFNETYIGINQEISQKASYETIFDQLSLDLKAED